MDAAIRSRIKLDAVPSSRSRSAGTADRVDPRGGKCSMFVDPIGRHTEDDIPVSLSLHSRTVTRGEGLSGYNPSGRRRRGSHRRMLLDELGLRIAATVGPGGDQ